jgi:hypothetical protein
VRSVKQGVPGKCPTKKGKDTGTANMGLITKHKTAISLFNTSHDMWRRKSFQEGSYLLKERKKIESPSPQRRKDERKNQKKCGR